MPSILRFSYDVLQRLALSLSAVIVVITFSYIMAKRITKPIKEMSNAAAEFSRGDFSKRIAVDSDDEIGQLA